jgi:hypothetical protein
MYPVSVLGFLLLVTSVLAVLRPHVGHQRLALYLGIATFMTGLLGTSIGVCLSAHYIQRVPPAKQLEIFALGIDESLHNVVLSLFMIVPASVIAAAGAFRGAWRGGAGTRAVDG